MSAAQILRQAEALISAAGDVAKGSPEAWISRQSLQDLYQRLLIMDLEYALDKKVEQDLWNHVFKNQITTFQNQTKDKLNPKRVEIQATLALFLDMASGFYLQLFQELSSAFKLDLSMRKRPQNYGILKSLQAGYSRMTMPKKSSSLYICQYCLVHLGDIARYRQQVDQAQTYYRHAASVVPYNGQPYNQLAILEAAKGNKLSMAFYYIRSIAVKHPFPVASTNLEKFYTKITKDSNEYKNKLSVNEVISSFLQFHALLHHCTDLDRGKSLSDRLYQGLTSHIPSSFSAYQLLQMTTINLFALHHAKRKLDLGGKEDYNKGEIMNGDMTEELSPDERNSYDLIFEILLHTLDTILQCAPKHEAKLKEHHTLPALKVILDWLCSDGETLQHPHFNKFTGIWANLAKTLNNLQFSQQDVGQTSLKKYNKLPLPEDRDLQCFVPLTKAHKYLDFLNLTLEGVPESVEPHLRQQRLTQHGMWIAEESPSLNLLNVHKYKSGRLEFTATTPQIKLVPGESDGVLETRTVRQNVAIQAIMQSKAKQSPGRTQQLEKSKSEPLMRISEADLEAKKNAAQEKDKDTNSNNINISNDSTEQIQLNPVKTGPVLERKQSKMAAVWESASDSSVTQQQQQQLQNNLQNLSNAFTTLPEATPPRGVSQTNSQVQVPSVLQETPTSQRNANQINTTNTLSPGNNDPWANSNKSSPGSAEKVKNESETRYFLGEPKTSTEMESIRSSNPGQHNSQGNNPFGLSAFGPLPFSQDYAGVRQPLQQIRPQSQFGAVERPGTGKTDMTSPPGQTQQQQRPIPGSGYPPGGLGPQLPFTATWGVGNRAPLHSHAVQQQQQNRIAGAMGEAMVRGGTWDQTRPMNPWGNRPPSQRPGWGNQVDSYRPSNDADNNESVMDSYPAPHPGAPPGASHPMIVANTTPRPIGPSANQLPLPNFKISSQSQQPPPAAMWETSQSQQPPPPAMSAWETRQMNEIHPTLRQLFQSAKGAITPQQLANQPPANTVGGNNNNTRMDGQMVSMERFPMDGQNVNRFPMDGQNANRFPMDGQNINRFPMDGQNVNRFPMDGQNVHRFPMDGQNVPRERFPMDGQNLTRERFSMDAQSMARDRFPMDGQHKQRERYPSSSDKHHSVFVGMETLSDGRRQSTDGGGGLSPYARTSEMSKPESPMAGSPGIGSLFSTTPDNTYPSPSSGTYSLFNSQSPWSLPINKDTHSHCSSPFGSSTASNRTSPDHFSADERSPNLPAVINLGYGIPASTAEGTWPITSQQPVGNSQNIQAPHANMLSNDLQTLWSGPSALERLLEAQRKQKADPH